MRSRTSFEVPAHTILVPTEYRSIFKCTAPLVITKRNYPPFLTYIYRYSVRCSSLARNSHACGAAPTDAGAADSRANVQIGRS
eukprot:6213885-Pleurochrysis_carterae.AAC.1